MRCCEWRKKKWHITWWVSRCWRFSFRSGNVAVCQSHPYVSSKGERARPSDLQFVVRKNHHPIWFCKKNLYTTIRTAIWTGQTGDPQSFSGDDRWFAWLLGHGIGGISSIWKGSPPLRSQPFEFFKKIRNNLKICDMCAGSIVDIEFRNDFVHFSVVFLKIFHGSVMVWT